MVEVKDYIEDVNQLPANQKRLHCKPQGERRHRREGRSRFALLIGQEEFSDSVSGEIDRGVEQLLALACQFLGI